MNCDPIARWYRWLEYGAFGRALERRRFAFLDQVSDARRILVLGDGDGRFLARLVESIERVCKNDGKTLQNLAPFANRDFAIDYVDISQRMLDLARTRAGEQRITYYCGDALNIALPPAEYDLAVTHFFLDCLDLRDAEALIARVTRALQPQARWLISEFREPGWWARAVVGLLYTFFRITTGLRVRRLIDHRALLASHGFALVREETALFGLLASELWLHSGLSDNGS